MSNFKDNEICQACSDMHHCSCPCDILTSNTLDVDYKDVISDIQDARVKRQMSYIEDIETVLDIRHRAICAMVFFSINVEDIAQILKISRRRVYQILKNIKKKLQ